LLIIANYGVVTAGSRPSYEELAAENAQLRALVEQLRSELAELKRQLGTNSQNSSKPPPSDSPFDKPAPKSLRRKSGRKPGGQPGHPGSTLTLVEDPDQTVRHEPGACTRCGADLSGTQEVGVERRQVFDLPPMRIQVTEHQLVQRRCGCGTLSCGAAPERVNAAVQYGPRVTAIILYLYVGQFLSKQRTAQALSELFGAPVSQGTVSAMTRRAADSLGEFTETVRGHITAAPVAGFDETGLRVEGALHWAHCARTDKYTLVTCHRKRGCEGIDDNGALAGFTGVAVHDAWAPYDTYIDPAHQLCCAHALRELAAVAGTAPPDAEWCRGVQAADALVAMQHLADKAGAGVIDPDELAKQAELYRSAVLIGINETTSRSNKAMSKHNALAHRLRDRQDDYLRFTTDPRIPADNNGSERDIRMIKLRQKVSGCMRTLTGAKQFCTIRSYLSTAAKNGHRLIDVLVMLAEDQPWLPATTSYPATT